MAANQKVVVITGASQGIGAALVKAYRERGFFVVANSRNIAPSADEGVLAVAGDIGEREVAERVVAQGLARFGRIDSLVNNAGISSPSRSPTSPPTTGRPISAPTSPASSS